MTGDAVRIDAGEQRCDVPLPARATPPVPARRADARRNRATILRAARAAFGQGGETSMAQIARSSGVGMATLYRNFPSRRELLEAVYADQAAAVCQAAHAAADGSRPPGEAFTGWLRQFAAFVTSKRNVAVELLADVTGDETVLNESRARVLAAARPLLADAHRAGQIRTGLSLEQICDMLIAVATIDAPPEHVEPIVGSVVDGLRA